LVTDTVEMWLYESAFGPPLDLDLLEVAGGTGIGGSLGNDSELLR
jgi:hypothetical protein